jgi:NAD(P)-dependent dehydrogenase (short-subunit alcohol dehydrogenase family)
MALGCDVTEREQVKAPVDAVLAEQGKLDVIVNKPRDHARAANSLICASS